MINLVPSALSVTDAVPENWAEPKVAVTSTLSVPLRTPWSRVSVPSVTVVVVPNSDSVPLMVAVQLSVSMNAIEAVSSSPETRRVPVARINFEPSSKMEKTSSPLNVAAPKVAFNAPRTRPETLPSVELIKPTTSTVPTGLTAEPLTVADQLSASVYSIAAFRLSPAMVNDPSALRAKPPASSMVIVAMPENVPGPKAAFTRNVI